MRITIADEFPENARAELATRGHQCVYRPETGADDLSEILEDCEVLVVRGTSVRAEAIEAASALRVIIRAGSGTNTIDCDTANTHGVYVCNVPGRNAIAVAELTCGLLLALDRHIADTVADLRERHWDKRRYAAARGIYGRNIGVLGLGQIGLAFAERVAAFGATVHAVAKPDRAGATLERAASIGVTFVDSLADLARTCDVLSLHLPAITHTPVITRELLELVQPGTIILNTARGQLIDEGALLEAMDNKGVRAGLDVFTGEPGASTGTFESRLAQHPRVYGTHHIGASTEQAQHEVATEVVRMVGELALGNLRHCVNPESAGQHQLVSTGRDSPR